MSASGIKLIQLKQTPDKIDQDIAIKEAISFVLPSIIITASSILLFYLLNGMTGEQLNRFVTIIFLALIPSLLGAAGIQVGIYRIIQENPEASGAVVGKFMFLSSIFAITFSAAVGGLIYAFLEYLGLTITDFFYLAAILVLFTMIWIFLTIFWATQQFHYPIIIVTLGFLSILAATLGFNRINPEYTIAGYTLGVFILFEMAAVASLKIFSRSSKKKSRELKISLPPMVMKNLSIILFSVLYVLVIFLDKIIVWIYQGSKVDMALLIDGPYTQGAFLGLIPVFSVVVAIYFGRASSHLVKSRYEGTLSEIKRRNTQYLKMYRNNLAYTLLIWAILFLIVIGLVYFLIPDSLVFRTTVTIGTGTIFLVLILYNSQLLITFGRERISALAMFLVVAGELASIFFVHIDVWFAAAGFLAGAILGFSVIEIYVWMLMSDFEFNTYRYVTRSAGLRW